MCTWSCKILLLIPNFRDWVYAKMRFRWQNIYPYWILHTPWMLIQVILSSNNETRHPITTLFSMPRNLFKKFIWPFPRIFIRAGKKNYMSCHDIYIFKERKLTSKYKEETNSNTIFLPLPREIQCHSYTSKECAHETHRHGTRICRGWSRANSLRNW